MKKLFALFGLLLLAAVILTVWHDYNREWKKYQSQFYTMQLKLAQTPKEAEAIWAQKLEVKRHWLEEIGRVDRCITCHLGVADPRFKDAPQPYRTHPPVANHPFEDFGCTLCHQGQGRATTVKAAHGQVEYWPEPLLEGSYLQSACARCHEPEGLKGAPILALGDRLYNSLGCKGCHKLQGVGGDIGPDLSKAGKLSSDYLKESLIEPKANDPTSVMPGYAALPPEQVEALVVRLMSFGKEKPPGGLMPRLKATSGPPAVSLSTTPGEALYSDLRCYYCHAKEGKGGKLGPSLDRVATTSTRERVTARLKEPAGAHLFLKEMKLSDAQVSALTGYLVGEPKPAPPAPVAAAPTAEGGKALYAKFNCALCHKIAGQGGTIGPDLTKAGAKRDADWQFKHLKDPQAIVPGSTMPNLNLSDADARALTAYLVTLK